MFQTPCYCIQLRRAAKCAAALYDRHLAPCGITGGQFCLLLNLNELKSASVSELAKRIDLERTTLVRTLKPLLARRLVEDTSSPGTRNSKLRLTEIGEEVLASAIPLWEDAQRVFSERLGEERLLAFSEIMDVLRK